MANAANRKRRGVDAKAGEVFLMPLADGRFGLCRVLAVRAGGVLVSASPWIGTAAPTSLEPAREILRLTHHAWNDKPAICNVSDRVPKQFARLGVLPIEPAETAIVDESYGGWPYFPIQVRSQWRWDHEREAVLAEDSREQIEERAAAERASRAHTEYLAGLTLDKLRPRRWFARWKGCPSGPYAKPCRQVFIAAIDELAALRKPSKKTRLDVLQRCILALNELDARHSFIMTEEREDLCEAFAEVAHACGLPACDRLVDRWRDW